MDVMTCASRNTYLRVKKFKLHFWSYFKYLLHHGMARPQVEDGGTASDIEGSCE